MKKFLIVLAVVATAVYGGYTANNDNAMSCKSELQVENVELLAEAELGEEDCSICQKHEGFYCAIAYRSNPSNVYICLDYNRRRR